MLVESQISNFNSAAPKDIYEGPQRTPVPVPLPNAVNADLVNRYRFVAILWQFQSYPVVAGEQGLKDMSQSLLDRCVAVSMPNRPLTCQTLPGRRRRASISAMRNTETRPRPTYLPPCHCEQMLRRGNHSAAAVRIP
ncbi:hypothetical protein DAEQUDRAFT_277574 [Daedalea quercina L-15889]|uniref:Uncharacterized protein n=1 Tax=Daedalea quercina L-15889 TaxID=1314783 RepID=A0A165Q800_9APHY|nr:hypothetical protein DAEQUDRAFT_277574 [Daedalea quercina L-15889]